MKLGWLIIGIIALTMLFATGINIYSIKMSLLRIATAQEQISNNYDQECIAKGYKIMMEVVE